MWMCGVLFIFIKTSLNEREENDKNYREMFHL